MDTSKKEVQVRIYELTYLLPGTMSDQEIEKAKSEIDALLKKHKAEVMSVEDWGKKPLAYIMTDEGKKHTDAVYVHIVFKLPSLKAPKLERDVFLTAKVMR